jgi:hypothetical protein
MTEGTLPHQNKILATTEQWLDDGLQYRNAAMANFSLIAKLKFCQWQV